MLFIERECQIWIVYERIICLLTKNVIRRNSYLAPFRFPRQTARVATTTPTLGKFYRSSTPTSILAIILPGVLLATRRCCNRNIYIYIIKYLILLKYFFDTAKLLVFIYLLLKKIPTNESSYLSRNTVLATQFDTGTYTHFRSVMARTVTPFCTRVPCTDRKLSCQVPS